MISENEPNTCSSRNRTYGTIMLFKREGRDVSRKRNREELCSEAYTAFDNMSIGASVDVFAETRKIFKNLDSDNLDEAWKGWVELKGLKDLPGCVDVENKSRKIVRGFFRNCVNNLSFTNSSKLLLARDVLMTYGVKILKKSCENIELSVISHVMDFLLSKLICHKSEDIQKMAVKEMLRSCTTFIGDAISWFLGKVLWDKILEPEEILEPKKKQLKRHHSVEQNVYYSVEQNVYLVIYELLKISKLFAANMLRLLDSSLLPRPNNRLNKMKVLCKLFSEDFPFCSCLWTDFISHFKNTRELPLPELKLLCEYTHIFLQNETLREEWCLVLISRIEFEAQKNQEISFIDSVVFALDSNIKILTDDDAITGLLRNLLNHRGNYMLTRNAWEHLYSTLGELYKGQISDYELLATNRKSQQTASALLHILLGSCDYLFPQFNDWCFMLEKFAEYSFPINFDEKSFTQALLSTWIFAGDKQCVIQKMFISSKRTYEAFKFILLGVQKKCEVMIAHGLQYLLKNLPYSDIAENLLMCKLVQPLKCNPNFNLKLHKLLFSTSLNFHNMRSIIDEVKSLIVPHTTKVEKVVQTMGILLALIPSDENILTELLRLVEDCINDPSIFKDCSTISQSSGREGLRLLNEWIFHSPPQSFKSSTLQKMLKWSNDQDNGISVAALRCLWFIPFSADKSALKEDVKNLQSDWFEKIRHGTKCQVKMALRCLLSPSHYPEHETSLKVWEIISSFLANSNTEDRGLRALGSFARFCPPFLKNDVELYHANKLLPSVMKNYMAACDTQLTDSRPINQWVEVEKLPPPISQLVRAMRSLGKSIRYCGSEGIAAKVIGEMLRIIKPGPNEQSDQFMVWGGNRFRLEAACTILDILECPSFVNLASREVVGMLSSLVTDPSPDLKKMFATKVCRGLKPLKIHFSERGASRGNLPALFLGYLSLLGPKFSVETESDLRQWAETAVEEVFFSRCESVDCIWRLTGAPTQKCLELLPAKTLLYAVPILAAQPFAKFNALPNKNTSSMSVIESFLVNVAKCFAFIVSKLHIRKSYYQPTKDCMKKLISDARKKMKLSNENLSFQKRCSMVWDVLELVVEFYKPCYGVHIKVTWIDDTYFGKINQPRAQFETDFNHYKESIRKNVKNFFKELGDTPGNIPHYTHIKTEDSESDTESSTSGWNESDTEHDNESITSSENDSETTSSETTSESAC